MLKLGMCPVMQPFSVSALALFSTHTDCFFACVNELNLDITPI